MLSAISSFFGSTPNLKSLKDSDSTKVSATGRKKKDKENMEGYAPSPNKLRRSNSLSDIGKVSRKSKPRTDFVLEAQKLFTQIGLAFTSSARSGRGAHDEDDGEVEVGKRKEAAHYHNLDVLFTHPQSGGKVYVGNDRAASNLNILLRNRITSVVNCTRPARGGTLPNYHASTGKLRYFDFPAACWVDYVLYRQDGSEIYDENELLLNLLKFVKPMLRFLDKAVKRGENVLIHCLAGAHRAGTTGILALMYYTSFSAEKATKLAQQIRPVINPISDFPEFIKYYEKCIQRKLDIVQNGNALSTAGRQIVENNIKNPDAGIGTSGKGRSRKDSFSLSALDEKKKQAAYVNPSGSGTYLSGSSTNFSNTGNRNKPASYSYMDSATASRVMNDKKRTANGQTKTTAALLISQAEAIERETKNRLTALHGDEAEGSLALVNKSGNGRSGRRNSRDNLNKTNNIQASLQQAKKLSSLDTEGKKRTRGKARSMDGLPDAATLNSQRAAASNDKNGKKERRGSFTGVTERRGSFSQFAAWLTGNNTNDIPIEASNSKKTEVTKSEKDTTTRMTKFPPINGASSQQSEKNNKSRRRRSIS